MSRIKRTIDTKVIADTEYWPNWPIVSKETERGLLAVLRSGRWTVSGAYTGNETREQAFGKTFAEYIGVDYCIPTCHGSSALTIALQALGVAHGDEVLVPGLTWVACASSVAALGALPVLVDVTPNTLCMDIRAAEKAINPKTKAIMLVHSYGSSCEIDEFVDLSERLRIPILEDFSQSHGAVWKDKKVGSFGKISACSFQQTKLLTSGEGGAALTNDPVLADRLQQFRADGRRYVRYPVKGYLDIEEVGDVQGRNFCLSEFHASLLIEGLNKLDNQNDRREKFVVELALLLEDCAGVSIQSQPKKLTSAAYYHLCLQFDLVKFSNMSIEEISRHLSSQLSIPEIEPVDTPLSRNTLYDPNKAIVGFTSASDIPFVELPNAEIARRTSLTLPHRVLLAEPSDAKLIVDAIENIRQFGSHLKRSKEN